MRKTYHRRRKPKPPIGAIDFFHWSVYHSLSYMSRMLFALSALVYLALSPQWNYALELSERKLQSDVGHSDEKSTNFQGFPPEFKMPDWLPPDIFKRPRRPSKHPSKPIKTPPLSDPSKDDEASSPPRDYRRLLEGNCGVEMKTNIWGGKMANVEDFPWMVLLGVRLRSGEVSYGCAGSLISSQYVLTAAHCVRMDNIPENALERVRLGEYDTKTRKDCVKGKCNKGAVDVQIAERIVHRGYTGLSNGGNQNDIALLRLKRPVKFNSYVSPVCLPLDDLANKNYDGTKMWAAGWGLTQNGKESSVKKKVKIPVMPLGKCRQIFEGVGPTQICAGGERGRNTCNGDSGGPLMNQQLVGGNPRWIIQGIVSFGSKQCAGKGVPAVYTRVGKYINWILSNMRK